MGMWSMMMICFGSRFRCRMGVYDDRDLTNSVLFPVSTSIVCFFSSVKEGERELYGNVRDGQRQLRNGEGGG